MAYFLFFSLLLSSFIHFTSSIPTIGVTFYSPNYATATTSVQPPPDNVSSVLNSLKITTVRLPDPNPSLVKAFAFTNTSLLLSIPNYLVPPLASNFSLALHWLNYHVLPFYPRTNISLISVGNSVIGSTAQDDLSSYLFQAMRNVHRALQELGIGTIPISTTFSFFSTITTAFPPSSAEFQQPYGELIMKPLLRFLEQTNSYFLINLYPYNLFCLNSEIPVGFALFQEHPFNFRDDLVTGVRYFNLFDMMADAVVTAMAVMGHANIPVIVAETGWPSGGGEAGEVEANGVYAEMYFKGLVKHLKSGVGTPLKKEGMAVVYVFELMDHNDGDNAGTSRKWGILTENLTRKYKVEFFGNGDKNYAGSVGIFMVIMWFLWEVYHFNYLNLGL